MYAYREFSPLPAVLTKLEGEDLQDPDESKIHKSEPHAKVIPGLIPEGQECIRINAAFVLFAESTEQENMNKTQKSYNKHFWTSLARSTQVLLRRWGADELLM